MSELNERAQACERKYLYAKDPLARCTACGEQLADHRVAIDTLHQLNVLLENVEAGALQRARAMVKLMLADPAEKRN